MKRLFTLLSALTLALMPALAQDEIDESYVFVNQDGDIIEHGSTIMCTTVEEFEPGVDVINSGLSVLNVMGESGDQLKMHYNITRIDNGSFQICFPITCNTRSEVGEFETSEGPLMGDFQNLQSEWFPTEDGVCIVEYQIEIMVKPPFPPIATHKACGPKITVMFVKGEVEPSNPADVNGDGEVTVADINVVINSILTGEGPDGVDVNGDGEVTVADVNIIIDTILGKNA